MIPLVGYIIRKSSQDRWGVEGQFYNYLLAGNGVFVEGENDLLWARVLVAEAEVRGLEPLTPALELKHGKIPYELGLSLLGCLLREQDVERFVVVRWNGAGYELEAPRQEQGPAHVSYTRPDHVLFEAHSHPRMAASFSLTDDADEQGVGFYGVLGLAGGEIAVRLRVGIYGYFMPVVFEDVFTSPLQLIRDLGKL